MLKGITAIVLECRECQGGERYKGGSMYRLLRNNVYLAKEYTLKNIFISHARTKDVCVYREDHCMRHNKTF